MAIITPRISRNIEKSTIDYIRAQVNANWSGVTVVKTYKQVRDLKYPDDYPIICVRIGAGAHPRVGLGSTSTRRNPVIFIDIYAKSDGQRLDLKDFIIETLKPGWTYYEYTYENGVVKTQTESGRLSLISSPEEEDVDLGIDKDQLNVRDRFRHLVMATISTGKVES